MPESEVWVPESEAWSECRKARLGVGHVAVTPSYYTQPSRLQGKGATDQQCHHTGLRHKHFCVWLKPVYATNLEKVQNQQRSKPRFPAPTPTSPSGTQCKASVQRKGTISQSEKVFKNRHLEKLRTNDESGFWVIRVYV